MKIGLIFVYFSGISISYGYHSSIETTVIKKNNFDSANIHIRAPSDSLLNQKKDVLEIKRKQLLLKAQKTQKGVCLKYHFLNDKIEHTVYFSGAIYSDWIFIKHSLGIVNSTSFKKVDFCIIGDSLLLLPLIGATPDIITLNIINLKTEEIICSDVRTSFKMIWFNEKKLEFITTYTPQMTDSTYKYIYFVDRIEKHEIKDLSKDSIVTKSDISGDFKLQYKLIK